MNEKFMPLNGFLFRCAFAALLAFGLGSCVDVNEPTVDEARAFVDEAETRLLSLWQKAGRASWVQNNFINQDTNQIAASANADAMAATTELAVFSARFDDLRLPEEIERKLTRLKTALSAVAPSDFELQQELSVIMTEMESIYGQSEYCPDGSNDCLSLPDMERMFAEVRETDELLSIWQGWREVSPQLQPLYERFVELSNAGAEELGFSDLGEMWRSGYDMPAEDFMVELERLWNQVRPLYESLHCHVRAELSQEYGSAIVPLEQPIPAHLLGNMWSQSWSNIYDIVGPNNGGGSLDLTRILRQRGIDELEMVRYGERFFTSLGFDPLPETFWSRSLFIEPVDRDVVCHASAWNLDYESDIRIKMCIDVNQDDFVTIHHELGHSFYQRAYSEQDLLFRDSANDGFHEGIGDTISLSITPEYLEKVGLLDRVPEDSNDVEFLLRRALDKIAFLPFGLVVDQWRWKVFAGEIVPSDYNSGWWDLRKEYQGIRPPVSRSADAFDPGAKYHVPANTPYTRYFLAHILQFQFHRALCDAAGFEGELHRCSIFDSKAAGQRLREMLEMGASRPWPQALEVIAGTKAMDASAILDYFQPLADWLEQKNQDRACGWQ
jgi:peptidyl-dipeptidase A